MDKATADDAELVFGLRPVGDDLRSVAAASKAEFVRTQFHLSVAIPEATGFRFSALEALDQYGWEVLSGLAQYHSVSLVERDGEPFTTLRQRAESLGLHIEKLQSAAGWGVADKELFADGRQVSFRKLDQLASKLGLQGNQIGQPGGGSDDHLGARLRTLTSNKETKLTPSIVSAVAESARLIADYEYVRKSYRNRIKPTFNVVSSEVISELREVAANSTREAPWSRGFRCADACRALLDIGANTPINSVSSLIEKSFDLLFLHINMEDSFSGCAIQRDDARAIMLNIATGGGDIVIQRIAMAHELGHILMDSDRDLGNVRVDQDRIFDENVLQKDGVESRANAFAVQFLAPRDEVGRLFAQFGGDDHAIVKIMAHFGVGQTIVRWQLRNGLNIDLGSGFRKPTNLRPWTVDKWMSREISTATRLHKAIPKIPYIRQNKITVMGSKLFIAGIMSRDVFHSILGYPSIDPMDVARAITKWNALNQMYEISLWNE